MFRVSPIHLHMQIIRQWGDSHTRDNTATGQKYWVLSTIYTVCFLVAPITW